MANRYYEEDRNRAFEAINGELDYQEQRWPNHFHNTGDFIIFMEEYLGKAKKAMTKGDSKEEIQDIMRKATALGFANMIENGVVNR